MPSTGIRSEGLAREFVSFLQVVREICKSSPRKELKSMTQDTDKGVEIVGGHKVGPHELMQGVKIITPRGEEKRPEVKVVEQRPEKSDEE